MANIKKVDYKTIPTHAELIKADGKEINDLLSQVYTSIANMHTSWYGVRYSTLVKEFEKIRPNVDELLNLVVGEIPFALCTAANNYSLADTGAIIKGVQKEAPTKIPTLNAYEKDVGMRFITSEVTNVQNEVSKKFQTSVEKMNDIETKFKKITEIWESDASTAFTTRFTKLKGEITKAFSDLNTQFTTLMNQTKEDIQKAETSNTVS